MRMELAEFNKAAKVLRAQAKRMTMEAGLRVHAELTGKLFSTSKPEHEVSPHEPEGFPMVDALKALGYCRTLLHIKDNLKPVGHLVTCRMDELCLRNMQVGQVTVISPILGVRRSGYFHEVPLQKMETSKLERLDGVPALKPTAMKCWIRSSGSVPLHTLTLQRIGK